MTSSDDAHPSLSATHYCKDCGALWRQCDDFSWNLRQLTCCKQCDNTPVGGQLIALTELVAEQQERLKASDRTKKIDAIRRLYLKDLDATSDIELATEVIGKEIAVARERGRLEGLDRANEGEAVIHVRKTLTKAETENREAADGLERMRRRNAAPPGRDAGH